MKFSEKMLLLKQGATFADVKKMEEEEALEIAEGKKHEGEPKSQEGEPKSQEGEPKSQEGEPKSQEVDNKELLSALEAATLALEESKATIDKQKKDYELLNEEFLKLTNSQTVNDNVTKTGADVFAELFNNQSNKEES